MSAEDLPVTFPECICFDRVAATGGAPYRIFMRRPPGDAPAAGWPVLYLLDGNAIFATAVEALRAQAPWPLGTGIRDAVVVAIGYPTEAAYDSVRRSWDLGPPPGQTFPPHTEGGPPVRTGGADLFLAFLTDVVKPEIASRVPVDSGCQALFGHSFGGLFTLHGLFQRPDAFTHWIAVSPTIWWNDGALLVSADRYMRRPARPAACVLLSVGAYEQRLAPFQIGAPDAGIREADHMRSRLIDKARAISERLDALPEVKGRFSVIAEETHMSVLPTAVNQAIRFAFGCWP